MESKNIKSTLAPLEMTDDEQEWPPAPPSSPIASYAQRNRPAPPPSPSASGDAVISSILFAIDSTSEETKAETREIRAFCEMDVYRQGNVLDLSGKNLTDDHMPTVIFYLENREEINVLILDGNCIGDEGMCSLSKNSTLTAISLQRNIVGDKGAQAIANHPKLTHLDIFGNIVGDLGAIAISQNPRIKALDISHNQVGKYGFISFAGNTTLKILYIGRNVLFGKIRKIDDPLEYKHEEEAYRILAQNQTLEFLSITGAYLGDESVIALAQSKTLKALDLSRNDIGSRGFIALLQNKSLQVLDLRNNSDFTPEVISYLNRNKTLKAIAFKKNGYSPPIHTNLKENTTLVLICESDTFFIKNSRATFKKIINGESESVDIPPELYEKLFSENPLFVSQGNLYWGNNLFLQYENLCYKIKNGLLQDQSSLAEDAQLDRKHTQQERPAGTTIGMFFNPEHPPRDEKAEGIISEIRTVLQSYQGEKEKFAAALSIYENPRRPLTEEDRQPLRQIQEELATAVQSTKETSKETSKDGCFIM